MLDSSRIRRPESRPRPNSSRRRRRGNPAIEGLEGRALLSWTFTPLGKVEQYFDSGIGDIVAINSKSEIAQTLHNPFGNSKASFLDEAGTRSTLAPLATYTESYATSVNYWDNIVGYSSNGGYDSSGPFKEQAVLYSQGVTKSLGSLGGTLSAATGINYANEVVGYSTTSASASSPTHAFSEQLPNGSPIDLKTLGGDTSEATAVSDAGQIVGFSTTTPGTSGPTEAFLLSGNGPLTAQDGLGVPQGYTNSYANSINSDGVVVGYATEPDGGAGTISEAFEYTTKGGWVDMGNLGNSDSVATAINLSGEVVGYSEIASSGGLGSPPIHAFLYNSNSGVMEDLNDVLPGGSKWTLETATGINDRGVIVGVATDPDGYAEAYELIPPTTTASPPSPSPPSPSPPSTPTNPTTLPKSAPIATLPIAPAPAPVPVRKSIDSGPERTRTILTVTPRLTSPGGSVTLTATVVASNHSIGTPAGTVSFLDGNTLMDTMSLSSGIASFQTSSLHAGRNVIRVVYGGGGSFNRSTSATVIETVRSHRTKARVVPSQLAVRQPATQHPGFVINLAVVRVATLAGVASIPGVGAGPGISALDPDRSGTGPQRSVGHLPPPAKAEAKVRVADSGPPPRRRSGDPAKALIAREASRLIPED